MIGLMTNLTVCAAQKTSCYHNTNKSNRFSHHICSCVRQKELHKGVQLQILYLRYDTLVSNLCWISCSLQHRLRYFYTGKLCRARIRLVCADADFVDTRLYQTTTLHIDDTEGSCIQNKLNPFGFTRPESYIGNPL